MPDEAPIQFKALEAQKASFAKAEQFKKAQQTADQLKNMRFFDRLEEDELNQHYLQFLYEAEVWRNFKKTRLKAICELNADINAAEFGDSVLRLENNCFGDSKDLWKLRREFLQFEKMALKSILVADPECTVFKGTLRLSATYCGSLLLQFQDTCSQGRSLSPELWNAVVANSSFSAYIENIVAVKEVLQMSLSLLWVFEAASPEGQDTENRLNDLNNLVFRVESGFESPDSLGLAHYIKADEIYEKITGKALLGCFLVLRNSLDPLVCDFCGLPFLREEATHSVFRSAFRNLALKAAETSKPT